MIGVILQWKEVQHLAVDELVKDIDLLIQFHQVFIETRALVRHFIISLF